MSVDGQYTRGDRSAALDTQLGEIRCIAQGIARSLAGSCFDKHGHSLQRTVEDGIYAAVFHEYLPTRAQYEQDVADDEAWDRAEAARDAA